MSPPKPPRASTIPDRDACPPKTVTPPKGHAVYPQLHHVTELAVPHEVADDVTGVLQGDALRAARGKRRTEERLDRLEVKHDEDRERDSVRDQRLAKVETGVEQLVTWQREDREERRLDRTLRAQTETNQVGLEKVRLNTRAKVVVAIFGLLTATVTTLATLAATGKL